MLLQKKLEKNIKKKIDNSITQSNTNSPDNSDSSKPTTVSENKSASAIDRNSLKTKKENAKLATVVSPDASAINSKSTQKNDQSTNSSAVNSVAESKVATAKSNRKDDVLQNAKVDNGRKPQLAKPKPTESPSAVILPKPIDQKPKQTVDKKAGHSVLPAASKPIQPEVIQRANKIPAIKEAVLLGKSTEKPKANLMGLNEKSQAQLSKQGKPELDGFKKEPDKKPRRRKILQAFDALKQVLNIQKPKRLLGENVLIDKTQIKSAEPIKVFSLMESDTSKVDGKIIQAVKQGEKIVIGTQSVHEVKKLEGKDIQEVPALKAISTVDELAKTLDIIEGLEQSIQQVEDEEISLEREVLKMQTGGLNSLDNESKSDTKKTDQHEKAPEITILVSDDLMTFIDKGKKFFEAKEVNKESIVFGENKNEEKSKKYVTISSSLGEIVIELEMLRKLLLLQKMRRHNNNFTGFDLNEIALEELNLHTMSPHDWNDDKSLLSVYQAIIFILGEETNSSESYDLIQPLYQYSVL